MNDLVKKAVQLFNGKEKYNCAQAVLIAFKDLYEVDEKIIVEAGTWGHGRADSGFCGAIEAAIYLSQKKMKAETVKVEFFKKVGSCYCKEIKKKKLQSCKTCVEIAAQILADL